MNASTTQPASTLAPPGTTTIPVAPGAITQPTQPPSRPGGSDYEHDDW